MGKLKEITKEMIERYCLMKLKYDFMGYQFANKNQLSFHHLILSHRECKAKGLGEGYWEWNGAILRQNTSHDYLHRIETYDYDRFMALTSELIDENVKGHLSIENLRMINDILGSFEREYCGKRTKKGSLIIKPEYVEQRILVCDKKRHL